MDANVEEIVRELAALTQRFADLGVKLSDAAQALQEAGAPPSTVLVEALSGAQGQFHQLRSQALTVADAAGVTAPASPESLHDLEPILEAIAVALRERARREALDRVQQSAVAVLDRALEVRHQDDPEFPALLACHAKAREVRATILALTDLESDDMRRAVEDVRTFADLVAMVEAREGVDDDRYGQLEESVSRNFGRPLAVAAARARLGFEGEFVEPPAPEPVALEPEPEPPAPVAAADSAAIDEEPQAEAPEAELELESAALPLELESASSLELDSAPLELESAPAPVEADREPAAPAAVVAPAAPEAEVAESSGPDETAQWWLAAWARWSGWKSNQEFAAAVREEIAKYPYLLSVPIQKSPEYEDGLLAYGYSLLMDHVEKQNPGCVGNALNSLTPRQGRRVGEQLYDYLITQGRLRETYADFVKNTLVAALPEPGVWFQFRILESKEDTRILQRPTPRIGDTELSGQRLASDAQRYNEHKFKMMLGPLTARFIVVVSDVRDARGAGFKLVANGAPSDSGWVVSVSAGSRSAAKIDAKRLTPEGVHISGLGREHGSLWVAIFNPDPAADRRCELSVFLRKDTKSPFRVKG
jgi:hypothetical protein